MAAFCIILRFVVSHPQDLRCRKTGQCRICRDFNETLLSNSFCDLLTFPGRSLITPDNGTADHLIIFIQHNKAMHLSGNTKSLDILPVHTGFLHNLRNGFQRRILPILRILLCPAVLRLIQRIFFGCRCNHGSVFIKQHCFCCGSSQINANQIIHIQFLQTFKR